jgi:hypothetical protein
MLRAHLTRTTGANTNVTLTVTHALGAVPDFWHLESRSDRGMGRHYVMPGTILTNTIGVRNGLVSLASMDIWVINYQGRLY